jgi:UDP-N-acetylmuramoyl-tripeptide--D-alanyl-D-alanine ligase
VHLENLGTIENVARAKAEIFAGLDSDGVAIYQATEPLLAPYVGKLAHKMTFGPKPASAAASAKASPTVSPTVTYEEVVPGPTGLTFRLHLSGVTSAAGVVARTPLIGAHNASNAAAAAAVALALDVGEGSILDGLATVQPVKHRAQLLQVGSFTVLDDCYNAAPNSMRAALDALVEVTPAGAQKIAVLGDMLELGPESAALHTDIGVYAGERVDFLITLGPQSTAMNDGARSRLGDERMLHTEDPKDAADKICEVGRPGDVVLVKASRGMRLERVIDALTEVCQRPRGADHEAEEH